MTSANPVLSEKRFLAVARGESAGDRMTIEGTVNRAAVSLLLVLLGAAVPWQGVIAGGGSGLWLGLGVVAALAGLGICVLTVTHKEWAGATAPLYAVLQGVATGGLSAGVDRLHPGTVAQAVALTFGTFCCMLVAYRSGLVRATDGFKLGVLAATGSIALLYLATLALGFFGVQVPLVHDTGLVGIAVSLVIVGVAALNLVLDFDMIEQAVAGGAPRSMEWYGAFGLTVTLVWLYIELLRLLLKLDSDD